MPQTLIPLLLRPILSGCQVWTRLSLDGLVSIAIYDSSPGNVFQDRLDKWKRVNRRNQKKIFKQDCLSYFGVIIFCKSINIGADLGAMGASINLIVPGLPAFIATIIFSVAIIVTEVVIPYRDYVRALKVPDTCFIRIYNNINHSGGNWIDILTATLTPKIQFTSDFVMMFVAIFGIQFLHIYSFGKHLKRQKKT